MLVIVPFTQFLKGLFNYHKNWPYYSLCIASIMYGIVAILLQVLNIYDLRDTLIISHLLIFALFVGGLYGTWSSVKRYGWTQSVKINTICLGICFLGASFDILFYYFIKTESASCFGILAFLIYISVLGFAKIEESRRLMEAGKKAEEYQNMAFIDSLTSMFSRMAFNHVTSSPDFRPNETCVIMCDLNNLKKCNDTYGHEAGDRYLTESAKLIQTVFDKYGVCFRMGGDEFAIVLKNVSLQQCEAYIKELELKQQEYVETHPDEFPIHIACGCAIYNPDEDQDFRETIRRADKIMYENKMKSKGL